MLLFYIRFHDKLQINFLESQVRFIPLVSYGQGTTIVSDPPLTSQLDLGPNFSNRPYNKIFHLTNKGRRHQQLVWSMDGFSHIAKAKKEMQTYNPLDMKYRVRYVFLFFFVLYLRPKVTLHCLFIYLFRIFVSDI